VQTLRLDDLISVTNWLQLLLDIIMQLLPGTSLDWIWTSFAEDEKLNAIQLLWLLAIIEASTTVSHCYALDIFSQIVHIRPIPEPA
jgi:hypothetical protein